jgi:hypothetical protein
MAFLQNKWINNILKDIRLWLLIALLVRLYGITQPPLETAHNWRQSNVCMVARNFSEVDADIRFPRIDVCGEKSGISGMEFPLLNYSIYLVSEFFGYADWYGRLINLIISTLGIYFFYRILKRFKGEKLAFTSGILLLCSFWFMYSRKIMPDTFSVSLVISGVYFGIEFLYSQKKMLWLKGLYIFLFFLLTTAGLLSKLPAGVILAPTVLILLDKKIKWVSKGIFVLVALLCCIPAFYWYFYWVPFLNKTFDCGYFFLGGSISTGALQLHQEIRAVAKQFYETPLKYTGFVLFLVGLYYIFRKRDYLVLGVFILILASFLIIMFKGGYTFAHHSYYMVPFTPVMAMIAAFGIINIPWKKITIYILLIICIENIGNQLFDFSISPDKWQLQKLEVSLNRFSRPDELIVINSDENPTPMYFAHRRGWVASNEKLSEKIFRDSLHSHGCKYLIVLNKAFGDPLSLPMKKIEDNSDWTIYSWN